MNRLECPWSCDLHSAEDKQEEVRAWADDMLDLCYTYGYLSADMEVEIPVSNKAGVHPIGK